MPKVIHMERICTDKPWPAAAMLTQPEPNCELRRPTVEYAQNSQHICSTFCKHQRQSAQNFSESKQATKVNFFPQHTQHLTQRTIEPNNEQAHHVPLTISGHFTLARSWYFVSVPFQHQKSQQQSVKTEFYRYMTICLRHIRQNNIQTIRLTTQ